ncbi:MAG: carbohydrate deacetylase [Clostridiales bacterium]|nr:carbohydrate deacetylase [Clostridiales bacterium]MCF8022735.1 carbohydrate deacetylase [Clostridiales bacterium]
MKLIVNADDLGYSKGVNNGIALAFSQGIVNSTTLMINQPAAEHALRLLNSKVIPSTGVHLVLTSGKPVCPADKVPTLVDDKGFFISKDLLFKKKLNINEISTELRMQVIKASTKIDLLTHLDTHHHVHFHSDVFEALLKVNREFKLPVRSINNEMRTSLEKLHIPTPEYFCGNWIDRNATLDVLISFMEEACRNKFKVAELMTHPAMIDLELCQKSSYVEGREKELNILCASETKKRLLDIGVKFCNYKYLYDI